MNKGEAKEYLKNTDLIEINLEILKKACKALKNDPGFLIDYPDCLGMYFKDIEPSAWHNVLSLEMKEPKILFNKLRLISYLVFSNDNLDTYLRVITNAEISQALALSKIEFDQINVLFAFSSKNFYFGYCKKDNKYIVYLIKK